MRWTPRRVRRKLSAVIRGRIEPNYAYGQLDWKPELPLREFIALAYGLALCRHPGEPEIDYWQDQIESNNLPAHGIFQHLVESPEYRKALAPLNHARLELIQRLPRAEVVVDLGGSTPHSEDGALYLMGYAPRAQRLVIVDLPPEDRFGEWKKESDASDRLLEREWGTVEYWYLSLAELDRVEEQGFAQLVWSGNSIEHISEDEGDRMIAGAYQLLEPGGHFCLDTPNRSVTRRLLHGAMSHPDHKLEYDHAQLAAKLEKHGFQIEEAYGVMDCSAVDESQPFSIPVQMACPTFTDDIDEAFFLYDHCVRP